jgi:hypothetical protein
MNQEIPLSGQVLVVAELDGSYDAERTITVDVGEANLITSRVAGTELHKPVLDIDLPATLLPSSTPGHFHLLIDHEMPWNTFVELLEALVKAGLVEPGYVNASLERGYTAVRLPWVRKAGA